MDSMVMEIYMGSGDFLALPQEKYHCSFSLILREWAIWRVQAVPPPIEQMHRTQSTRALAMNQRLVGHHPWLHNS